MADRLRKTREEALEVATWERTLGVGASASAESPIKISAHLDLASLLDEAHNTAAQAQATLSAERAERMHVMEMQLDTLKTRLEAGGKSELETYREVKGLMEEMAAELKQSMGIATQGPVSATDVPGLLQIEQLRLDREERQRQWQDEMEERRHQWQVEQDARERRYLIEDRQWSADHELRKSELELGRETRTRATDALSDLAASVIEGIDTARGPSVAQRASKFSPAAPTPTVEEGTAETASPKSFTCEECGGEVLIPGGADEGMQVKCQSCEAQYLLRETAA